MILINSQNAYEEYIENIDSLMHLSEKLNYKAIQAKRQFSSDCAAIEKEKEVRIAAAEEGAARAERVYSDIRGLLGKISVSIPSRKRASGNENCKSADFYLREQARQASEIRNQVELLINKAAELNEEKRVAEKELQERKKILQAQREAKERRERELAEKALKEEEKALERARIKEMIRQQELLKQQRKKVIVRVIITAIIIIFVAVIIGILLG